MENNRPAWAPELKVPDGWSIADEPDGMGRVWASGRIYPDLGDGDLGRGSCEIATAYPSRTEAIYEIRIANLERQLSSAQRHADFWVAKYQKLKAKHDRSLWGRLVSFIAKLKVMA